MYHKLNRGKTKKNTKKENKIEKKVVNYSSDTKKKEEKIS